MKSEICKVHVEASLSLLCVDSNIEIYETFSETLISFLRVI